jgi:hypothetical protein
MKLADMRDLKSRPLLGPGSIPGVGKSIEFLKAIATLKAYFLLFLIPDYRIFFFYTLQSALFLFYYVNKYVFYNVKCLVKF